MEHGFDPNGGCAVPDPRLAALLDGELPPDEHRQLAAHAAFCLRCAGDLAQQRAVQAALRRTAAVLVPPMALRSRVRARLAQESARRAARRWLLVLSGAAAALALLVVALVSSAQRAPDAAILSRVAASHQQQTVGASPVSFASPSASEVSAWARARTGKSIDIPSLEPTGYHLLGARVDSDVAPHAIALVYQGPSGRLTCTIVPSDTPQWARLPLPEHAADVHVTQVDDVAIASWMEGDAAYVMAADLSPDALLRIARMAVQTAFE